jgi:NADH-quinone oxidoreductase subunit H
MMVTLFFGGWSFPGFDAASQFWSQHPYAVGFGHIGLFVAKMLTLMVVFIWVRWMLPRFRYDQLMDLGWRRFIPLALVNILVTAVVLWLKAK